MESDTMIESALRRLFDVGCLEYCRLKVLSDINDKLKCVDLQNFMTRGAKRAKLDFSADDDLFMPVRGRRTDRAPPQLSAEKKAKLDLIVNDLFLPHRGRRDMNRKNVPQNPSAKRAGFELNEQDFFVPRRGKRPTAIIPKSQTTFVNYPWLLRSINSDDSGNMIDRLRDLNQLGPEVGNEFLCFERKGKKLHFECLSMSFHFHLSFVRSLARLRFFLHINKVVILKAFLSF